MKNNTNVRSVDDVYHTLAGFELYNNTNSRSVNDIFIYIIFEQALKYKGKANARSVDNVYNTLADSEI